MKNQFYAKVSQIDRVLASETITLDLAKSAISMVNDDESLRRYFLSQVRAVQWFDFLFDADYFAVKTISFDTDGNALFWNVLDYLERVSEQVSQNPQHGIKLLDIIENVVQFSISKKKINNYHIWWYCVKIVNNLPCNIIKRHLSIADVNTWLSVWTDHSMGGDLAISEIGSKLLPKFLADDLMLEYAETLIDVITQIKPGKKSDVITKREDPVLAWSSFWIRDSFSKYAALVGQKCSLKAVFGIANRLKMALEYKQKDYYVNIDVGQTIFQIAVSRVSKEGTPPGTIDFKVADYDCTVKQFSPDQLKGVDRQTDYWALHNITPEYELKRFILSAVNQNEMVSNIQQNLPPEVDWKSAESIEQKLGDIFEGLHSDYSHIWLKSLLGGGSEHATDADEVLAMILRDVLLSKCEANRLEGRQILDAFLNNNYQFPIFRRYVLLCADKFWTDYGDFVDSIFEILPNALDESDLEVELQDILRNHHLDFSQSLKAKLKALVSNIPDYYIKKGDKAIAFWQYKWLSPLHANPDFKELYEEAKQKAEPKDDKPYEPTRSAIVTGFVGHKSPISKDAILEKSITDLVKYLKEYQGAEFWRGVFENEPDKEGLADAFQSAVKDNPKKFTDEIDAFLEAGYFYIHRLLRGIKESWAANKDIDWTRVFEFAITYLSRDKNLIIKDALSAQGEDSGQGRYLWVVEDVVDLIADGCRDDKRAFSPIHFDAADRVFDLVLPLLKGEKKPDTQRDAITYALNTTLGRTVLSCILFALRKARATQKKEENWGQKKYAPFLPIGIDSYIWLGRYLPQIKYLDEKYAIEIIEMFSNASPDDFEWLMFMEGYLNSRVYEELYRPMRVNYLKGLDNKVFDGRVEQRLVEHICLGYFHVDELLQPKNEDGQDSLFWKLLTGAGELGKGNRWIEVSNFFWSLAGETLMKYMKAGDEESSEKIRQKILAFWAWTFDHQDIAIANLGNDYNIFLGKMAELPMLLKKIDAEKEQWLLLCTPHIEQQHNTAFFIEYLTKFEDEESVKRIGKIFLKMLEYTTPTFRQENITTIVRRIYEKGNREDAEAICNTYGSRGVHFLKPVWEENQE